MAATLKRGVLALGSVIDKIGIEEICGIDALN